MSVASAPKVALLYPGSREMRDRADPAESRFAALFAAIEATGMKPEPAIWRDDFAEEVATQLQRVDAVLVWCNPIEGDRRRDRLDGVLTDVARGGTFVSAHPDTILRLGTKDVLFETRDLPFGSDVHRIDGLAQLEAELPRRLQGGARVLKQYRGHSGIGVWRVQQDADGVLRVQHAARGSPERRMTMAELSAQLGPYFQPEAGGHMIDQAWQPGLEAGMVRAYLVEDQVAGFGHQEINALHPTGAGPGARLYHGADLPQFQSLRQLLESGWISLLRERVGVPRDCLPLLWDCDFFCTPPGSGAPHSFVLCEVNVSSVSPFPPSVIPLLVEALRSRLGHCAG